MTQRMDAPIRLAIEVPLPATTAFEMLIDELGRALHKRGVQLTPGADGSMTNVAGDVARITLWQPPRRLTVQWERAGWQDSAPVTAELHVRPRGERCRIYLTMAGVLAHIGSEDCLAWFAENVAAPLIAAAVPGAMGDWITDRRARRPEGATARTTYSDPIFHYPNFGPLLAELAVTPADMLLEVGCGGGALLREVLQTGCRAVAVDHSADMVETCLRNNADAVASGRLAVHEARAEELPFAESTFTCATMTGVLGFLDDPVAVLREIRRVLRPGGRLVAFGSDPAWRGTPAAPEPFASRLHFYTDPELVQLARDAGFEQARVVRHDLEPFARGRVPDQALPLFRGMAPYLVAC